MATWRKLDRATSSSSGWALSERHLLYEPLPQAGFLPSAEFTQACPRETRAASTSSIRWSLSSARSRDRGVTGSWQRPAG